MGSTARDVIAGLERLRITQGAAAGERLLLMPWQRRWIHGALRPGVQTAALTMARGGSKTTTTAALALAALMPNGPLARPRGETLIIASSFAQGKIAFEHALAFLRPALESEPRGWRVEDSANAARVTHRATGQRLRCVGSDPNRLHGPAPALILADEPAQWPRGQADAMFAALETALGKQADARLLAIGTRPADDRHWFGRLLDGGADFAQAHVGTGEPFHRRTWEKANPSLRAPAFAPLLAAYRTEAKRAKVDASAAARFRALRLNLGASEVVSDPFVALADWQACVVPTPPAREGLCVVGLDLGGSASLTAAAAYWPASGRLEAWVACGTEPDLWERGRADGCGGLYVDLARRGELRTYAGRVTPVRHFLADLVEDLAGQPVAAVVGDRYREAEAHDALDAAGIHWPREFRGLGWRDGSEDVRAAQTAIIERRVRLSRSLALEAAIAESAVLYDAAGNPKLDRARAHGRIDALTAAVQAIAEGSRAAAAPVPTPAVMVTPW